MPTLRLAYTAPSAKAAALSDVRSYAFTPEGVLADSALSPLGASVDVLRGVAQVDYTSVSFAANGAAAFFSPLERGASRTDALWCRIVPSAEQAPELLYHRSTYAVRRTDTIETRWVEFTKLYYDVELRIDGPQWLSAPLDSYRVELSNLPSGYDWQGVALPPERAPYVRYEPTLLQGEANGPLRAWFRIGRFDTKRGFVFTLCQGAKTVVSALVADGVEGMKIEGDVLRISVLMNVADATLSVNDWELVSPQSPGIGG